jgi:hypothetical protein
MIQLKFGIYSTSLGRSRVNYMILHIFGLDPGYFGSVSIYFFS